MPTKLNLGCGHDIREGYINVDVQKLEGVDVVANLEDLARTPLPFEDNSIDEFLALHLIEHVQDSLSMMQELWRIARPGAKAHLRCPYGSSDDAWEDPTHVRPFFPNSFQYYSQPAYWRADYGYRGDWQIEKATLVMDESRYRDRPFKEIMAEVRSLRNTVYELRVDLRAVKPMRAAKRELQEQHHTEILLVKAG